VFSVSFCSLSVSEGKCNRFVTDLSKALYESVVPYIILLYILCRCEQAVSGLGIIIHVLMVVYMHVSAFHGFLNFKQPISHTVGVMHFGG
jgi:hypothetical protein